MSDDRAAAPEVAEYLSSSSPAQAQQVMDKAIRQRVARQQKRHQKETDALHQQVVRLSVENVSLRDRVAISETRATRFEGESLAARSKLERRDQTIAGLRQALNNRKDQTHV